MPLISSAGQEFARQTMVSSHFVPVVVAAAVAAVAAVAVVVVVL